MDNLVNTTTFLFQNTVLNTAIIACLIAQALKVIYCLIFERKFKFSRFFENGGMPSSHSALAIALVTSIGRLYSIYSPIFAVAVCFALIVMFDASGVRRAAGEQAKIINYMMENWDKQSPEIFNEKLRELLGHTRFEVVVGGVIGFIIGILPI